MLIWLLPLMLVMSLLKPRLFKGWIGEQLVRFFAHLLLDRKIYRRLHDVTLITPDGTTQIDHVFVSPFGVFVLETKNMGGWIFGGEKQAQWTQQIYKKRFKFQNPNHQNYKHLKALQAVLEIEPEHVHSVIAFVGGSTFKTEMPANVTQGMGLVRYIKSFQQPVFSEAQVTAMLDTLQAGRLAPTLATRREHVQRLKQRDDPSASRLCPRCGSALVVRAYKTGSRMGQQFWGCSTYPKCRTMQPLSPRG
ncbi:NERD domain-containing protein [Pseudomonas sp. 14P_8.1_Bac3]|nr:NERD domain-containing protein [Pseudomonas sp. 14P_8.1_Bac3]MCU1758375.1 NERD domain-containing protein [Pseudomonas sp. 14P_8.1_Bac3]